MPAKGWDATKPAGSGQPVETSVPPLGGSGAGAGPAVTVLASDPHPPTAGEPYTPRSGEPGVAVEDLDGTKKKKRKKKYSSKSARDFQEMGRGLSKGAFRMAYAVAIGLDTFYRNQNKSARKRKDGMMKDVMLNTARGLRDAGAEAARAPYDVYKRVDVWRQARRAMKMFSGS
jgi:hypothetical protein